MNKKSIRNILIIMLILAVFSIGARSINKIKITIGEKPLKERMYKTVSGDEYKPIDIKIPVKIPIKIDISALSPGCGMPLPDTLSFTGSGKVHLYYDTETGEKWARIQEVQYEFTLEDGKKYKVKKL